MNKPTTGEISSALIEKFGEAIISTEQAYDFTVFTVEKHILLPLFRFLHDDERFQFRYLTTACGIHFPELNKPYAMMYQVHSLAFNVRIRIKMFTGIDSPEFDSLTEIFPAANWMERETFDFYGFRFKGHPDLKRILNVEDMDYFPMRKEYPVEDLTRYDKDDTMFGRKASNFKKLN